MSAIKTMRNPVSFWAPRLTLLFASALPCSAAVAADLTAEHVLSINSPFIELRDSRGATLEKIKRTWVVHWVTVARRMSQAYRLLMPTLVILKQGEPNALVELRGGQTLLVVDTDMLRLTADDDDLMAAVISHEMAHLRKSQWRHGRAAHSIFSVTHLNAVATSDGRVPASSGDSKPFSTRFAGVGSSVSSVEFWPDQEHEIDALSVRSMVIAGYDPAAALRFWQVMQAKGAGSTGLWLTEHPLDAGRLHTLHAVASSLAEIYAADKAARISVDNQPIIFGARIAKMPATSVGLDAMNGVFVSEVMPQSPAAAAGIEPGDILLRVDGAPIDSPDDLKVIVADVKRGSMVEVKLMRRAEPVLVHVQF